jgi:nitrate reductase gamma subunit
MILINNILFSYYPYLAIFIFFIGSIYRYENNQYTWKSSSSQIFRKDLLFWSSNLFHFSIVFLMFFHFFGLMTPKFIYSKFISSDTKQLLAMGVGGVLGTFCLIGLTMLLYRRLVDVRVRINSDKSDIFVLVLLYSQLLLGLFSIFISYNHLDDPSSMIAFANWVQGIFIFTPDLSSYIVNEHWIFKCHLFLGMTILLVFPFTRLIHIFSFPYLYFLREGYQLVRSLR